MSSGMTSKGHFQMARKRRFKYISLVAITAGALSLLSLAGALSTSSHLANELATKNTATMVAGGLKSEVKTLQATVYDYSIWQAAYENAVVHGRSLCSFGARLWRLA